MIQIIRSTVRPGWMLCYGMGEIRADRVLADAGIVESEKESYFTEDLVPKVVAVLRMHGFEIEESE